MNPIQQQQQQPPQQQLQNQQNRQQQVVSPMTKESSGIGSSPLISVPTTDSHSANSTIMHSTINGSHNKNIHKHQNAVFQFGNQNCFSPLPLALSFAKATTTPTMNITNPNVAAVTIDTKIVDGNNSNSRNGNTAASNTVKRRSSPSMFNTFTTNIETHYMKNARASANPNSSVSANPNPSASNDLCTPTPTPIYTNSFNTNHDKNDYHHKNTAQHSKQPPVNFATAASTSSFSSSLHRRKRRRTNLNDAFRHLTIQQEQEEKQRNNESIYNSSISSLAFVSPMNGMHGSNSHNNENDILKRKLNYNATARSTVAFASSTQSLAQPQHQNDSTNNNDKIDHFNVQSNHSYASSYEINESTRSYDEMDGLVLHSNLDYNHETSFCSLTSTIGDNSENIDITFGTIDDDDNDENNDENNDHDSENNTNTNNHNESNQSNISNDSSTSLPPIHSILFAPRKDRNKQRTMIYDHSVNPVDDRLEELIRHSRIQAMVQSSKNNNASNSPSSSPSKHGSVGSQTYRVYNHRIRNYEKMIFDPHILSNNKNSNTKMKFKTMESCDDHDIKWEQSMNRKLNGKYSMNVDGTSASNDSSDATFSTSRNHHRSRSAPRTMKYVGGRDKKNDHDGKLTSSMDVEMN